MILTYELPRDEATLEARHDFIIKLEEREQDAGVLPSIVFSKKKLCTYYEADRVFILYYLEPSLPPVYLVGWLLAGFLWVVGFSWLVWLWPALFGLTGIFYSKPWYEFMFKLALRKAKVQGRRVTLEYFIAETTFKEVAGLGAN